MIARVASSWSKYRAQKITVDGITFDSKAEAKRWFDLRTLETNGLISRLERQVRFDFVLNGVNLGFYKADFRYFDHKLAREITEDVKGYRAGPAYAVFRIKAKLMEALHGVEVVEYPPKQRGRA